MSLVLQELLGNKENLEHPARLQGQLGRLDPPVKTVNLDILV